MSNLQKHLDEASETVKSWPAWKKNVLKSRQVISFAVHENDGEFVLRMYCGAGFVSLGILNGQEEADLVCRSLNLVCSDWASNADLIKQAWEQYAE